MVTFEHGVAVVVMLLHIFSFTFNLLLIVTARKNKQQMVTNRYILNMAFAEICLNVTQIVCIEPGLWLGFSSYKLMSTPIGYVLVTINQTLFLFRYYLCVLIVLHRAAIIVLPRVNQFIERHVGLFIALCWIYVIFINVAYFFFDCIRLYDAVNQSWMTTCENDDLLPLIILRAVSSYTFSYIPHFTVIINICVIGYIKYHRLRRNGVAFTDNKRKTVGKYYEYHMILQPLMFSCVLAVEPICFFVASVANKIVPIPPLPRDVGRAFNYAMTYISTLTNFVFYFICHRDIRQLMVQLNRKSIGPLQVKKTSKTVTISRVA